MRLAFTSRSTPLTQLTLPHPFSLTSLLYPIYPPPLPPPLSPAHGLGEAPAARIQVVTQVIIDKGRHGLEGAPNEGGGEGRVWGL